LVVPLKSGEMRRVVPRTSNTRLCVETWTISFTLRCFCLVSVLC